MRRESLTIKSFSVPRGAGLSLCAATPSDQLHPKAQACALRLKRAELWQRARGDFRLLANIACRTRAQPLLCPARFDKSAGNAPVRRESATPADAPHLVRIPGNNICPLEDQSRHRAAR